MNRSMAAIAILCMAMCARGATPAGSATRQRQAPAQDAAAAGSIPQSLHLHADFTRDGRPEDISIEFMQRDIQKPLSWILSIRNADGKVIYFDPHDDEGLDETFGEAEQSRDCRGYEQCKRRYYLTLLPRNLGRCLQPSTTAFLDGRRKEEELNLAAHRELAIRSLDAARIDAAIAEMKATLSKAGYIALCVPEGPDSAAPPMIWVEAVQLFVAYRLP
jgi:hypothetical protein